MLVLKKVYLDESKDDNMEEETSGLSSDDTNEKSKKKVKKSPRKQVSPQVAVFSDRSISNLSRGLGPNDWIKLAYALGFLPQV